jgi:hypothetical protein
VRTSSFVHGLTTRRDDLEGFAALTIFEFLAVFFKALGIIQVLQLSAAHIGTRCGDSKTARRRWYLWYYSWTRPAHDDLLTAAKKSEACDRETRLRQVRHAGRSLAIRVESPFRA